MSDEPMLCETCYRLVIPELHKNCNQKNIRAVGVIDDSKSYLQLLAENKKHTKSIIKKYGMPPRELT